MAVMDDAETRLKLIEKINAALANIPIAEKRVREVRERQQKAMNDFKAQVGTAVAELEKARKEYSELAARLTRHLPGVHVEVCAGDRASADVDLGSDVNESR